MSASAFVFVCVSLVDPRACHGPLCQPAVQRIPGVSHSSGASVWGGGADNGAPFSLLHTHRHTLVRLCPLG